MDAPSDERPRKRRVLVLDDAADHAELFALFLAEEGHEVETASDPLYALTLLRAFKPDVVFLDLHMPHLSGHEALPRMRKLAPVARFYVVTGRSDDEARRQSQEAGCDGYFVKPLDFAVVRKLLR